MSGPRVGVVIGTRPEAIKLSPVVNALRLAGADVRVCLTEQHGELLEHSLSGFGIAVDKRLGVMTHDQSPSQVCGKVMAGVAEWLGSEPPFRWVVVQGDTATALGAALSAFHGETPVAHVEAGLRTGDISRPWPEEIHRRIIAQVAGLHFAPTLRARDNLLREGVEPRTIEITGNTVIDALRLARDQLRRPGGVNGAAALLGRLDATRRRIVLATIHRRENLGASLNGICSAMAAIAGRDDCELVLVRHPNPRAAELATSLAGLPHARVVDPLDYISFVALMLRASLILTDSGGIQEEAAALGKPVLVVREKTERVEVLEGGNGLLVGVAAEAIAAHTARLLEDPALLAAMSKESDRFGDGFAAERIAERLIGDSMRGGR